MIKLSRKSSSSQVRYSCSGEDHFSAFFLQSTPHESPNYSLWTGAVTRRGSNSRIPSTILWGGKRRRDSFNIFVTSSATPPSSMDFSVESSLIAEDGVGKYRSKDLEKLLALSVTNGPASTDETHKVQHPHVERTPRLSITLAASRFLSLRRKDAP